MSSLLFLLTVYCAYILEGTNDISVENPEGETLGEAGTSWTRGK
jgi:hypothetical protein